MIIKNLNLVNFRNYSKLNLDLNPKMNIIIGKNASGKTNILESICVLALTKTYKNGVEPNLITFGKNQCKVRGKIKTNKLLKSLEVFIEQGNKILKINKTEIRKISDYISNLNVIVFTPEDIDIIKGSPSIRRNLLNMELSQLSLKYLNTYNEYNKLLKIRNEYLKLLLTSSVADESYLDIITDKLIENAVEIYLTRKQYIDKINLNIEETYFKITGEKKLFVKYEPNIEIDEFEKEAIRKKLKHTFKKNYKKELNYGMTLYGPHRDEFSFYLNENNLKYFGSQGQQKVAVLSFKLAEIDIFKEKKQTTPVLLLDDIFSELDITKRNKVLDYINQDIQSIITTTDIKNIRKKYLTDAYIYEIKNEQIERRN